MNMSMFGGYILVCVFLIAGTESVIHDGWKSHEKNQDSFLTEDMPQSMDAGGIIDLDDGAFDVALANDDQLRSPEAGKYGEDMREARPDGGHGGVLKRTHRENHVVINEGELITPVPYVFDTDDEIENKTIHANESDDEDVASGSGSGEIFIEIEDATNLFNATLDEGAPNITVDANKKEEDKKVDIHMDYIFPMNDAQTDNNNETPSSLDEREKLPFCEELYNVTWAPWSSWIRAGDVSVRFRRCPAGHGYENSQTTCHGDYFEVRACPQSDTRQCRTSSEEVTEEYHVTCPGIDLNDVRHIEELKSEQDRTDKCEYSLYDVTYGMMIGEPVNSDVLRTTNPDLWCKADNKYIPFHTPTEQCRNILKSFCSFHARCKNDDKTKKLLKNNGDMSKLCWKEFVIGGIVPTGFPSQSEAQMICQRFEKDGKLGKVLGHKHSHFATLYDINHRIPIVSMVTVRALGDTKWPHVPYMVERGFIEDQGASVISWFFKTKKRGITRLEDISTECERDNCKLGEKQALPIDYELSGYRIAHVITPQLVGNEMSRRISVFTMTNTVPIEPTIYPRWQYVQDMVRKFSMKECRIPQVEGDRIKKRHRNGHDLPEVYILAGAAYSPNNIEVIGNDVTVPKLIWLAACCAHGAEVSSFGVYMYNSFEQKPYVVSIDNLQMLLQSTFYDNMDVVNVNLFPAFDGVCSAPEHDFSYKLNIPF